MPRCRGRARRKSGRQCPYCGTQMAITSRLYHPTRDHLIPRKDGGNVCIIVCFSCNNLKADTPLEDWLLFMLEHRPKQLLNTMRAISAVRHALTVPADSRLQAVFNRLRDEIPGMKIFSF